MADKKLGFSLSDFPDWSTRNLVLLSAVSAFCVGGAVGLLAAKSVYSTPSTPLDQIPSKTLAKPNTSSSSSTSSSSKEPVYIYVAGDRSQVGKSTTCVCLIDALIKSKIVSKDEIGYIKPATQCISPTRVARYCLTNGIDCVPIGPIVYYRGYTNEVIDGKHGSASDRLTLIKNSVESLNKNKKKKVVIVDGVGYVSVGSVTDCDNCEVAMHLGAYTMLILRSGVGDSIDTSNLLLSYYYNKCNEKKSDYYPTRFLGLVFNFKEKNHRHSVESCKKYVTKFAESHGKNWPILGWLPPLENKGLVPDEVKSCAFGDVSKIDVNKWDKLTEAEKEWIDRLSTNFMENIDMKRISDLINSNI